MWLSCYITTSSVGCPESNSWSRDIYSGSGFTHSHQGNSELIPENRL
jgi:hypothetical protein